MKLRAAWLILVWFFSSMVFAATESPTDMLQTASDQMIASLQQNKSTLQTAPQQVYGIVNKILLPHVDIATMSRSVLGTDAWQKATAEQKNQFQKEFSTLLIRTYSSALAAYTNQTVKFMPIRGGYADKSKVQVDSKIMQPDGPSVPVSYRLALQDNVWKVYDFSVDGVSIIDSFRSQFATDLTQKGLPELIQQLAKHNAQNGK